MTKQYAIFTRISLITLACLLSLTFATLALASDDNDSYKQRTSSGRVVADLTDERVEKLFKVYWNKVAAKYAAFDDDFVACPTFNIRYPSSRGVTASDVVRENTEVIEVKAGAMMKKKQYIKPPKEDADAHARTLPKLALGEYGYIASCKIDEITSDDEMIVKDVWLIDDDALEEEMDKEEARLKRQSRDRSAVRKELDRRYEMREKVVSQQKKNKSLRGPVKMQGFSTTGLVEKERWTGRKKDNGIAVAVVRVDQIKKGKKTTNLFVLAPVKIFNRGGLGLSEFEQLMNKRDFDKRWFVYRVLEAQRDDEHDWVGPVIDAIEEKGRQIRAMQEAPAAEE